MSLPAPVAWAPGEEPERPPDHIAPGAPDPGGTAAAAGLAAATLLTNLVALAATLVFTRLLGSDGYGALAALINVSVILFVPGAALQVAVAREGALGRLGDRAAMAAALARWEREVPLVALAIAVVAVLAREPLAALLGVDEAWAAAAVPVTAGLFLLVSLQRGMLQAERRYRAVGGSMVGEAVVRLAFGVALVAAGLDVTGAYVAMLGSMLATSAWLAWVLRRVLGPAAPREDAPPLRALAAATIVPTIALTALAVLQNVDVILARHALPDDLAGAYAAATVAAKALLWVAVGVGMWVLPEAVRRAADGGDARTVLLRAFAVVGAVALPALPVFALAPDVLMRTAFGAEFEEGADVLLVLGVAYGLLAVGYLSVQFLLGVGARGFLVVLGAAALAEPLLLLFTDDLETFAAIVAGVLASVAAALLLMALRPARGRPAAAPRG